MQFIKIIEKLAVALYGDDVFIDGEKRQYIFTLRVRLHLQVCSVGICKNTFRYP
jgi:hypothetical protein